MVIPIPIPVVYVRDKHSKNARQEQKRQRAVQQSVPNCIGNRLGIPAAQTPPPPYQPYAEPSYNNSSVVQMPQYQPYPYQQLEGYGYHAFQPLSLSGTNQWQESTQLTPARPTSSRNHECPITRSMNQSAAFCDRIAARLNEAICRVDGDDGRDEGLEPYLRQLQLEESAEEGIEPQPRSINSSTGNPKVTLEPAGTGKSWMYANSRLPPNLPPLTVYMPTWRLLCMAARASQDVYQRPRGGEKEDYIDADWRQGTKAMVLKSSPVDDQNLIVFAIRGSQWNAIDWLVNLRPAPTAPTGFLDDAGNACHAGFLSVARSMIAPVAARLRHLLEQDPSRASSSLLITGHSAGGAVAALLFMHMLSTNIESELSILTGCFKRVHCVTFGAPPVSFLPLQKPAGKRFEKNVFLSFINEGDLVTRFADKAYITSLARLLAAPAPRQQLTSTSQSASLSPPSQPSQKSSSKSLVVKMSKQKLKSTTAPPPLPARTIMPLPKWPVPPATLSNAGRLVLLRENHSHKRQHGRLFTEAVSTSDQQLRDVIFGDIATHAMSLYKKRIDELAIAAVTGQ